MEILFVFLGGLIIGGLIAKIRSATLAEHARLADEQLVKANSELADARRQITELESQKSRLESGFFRLQAQFEAECQRASDQGERTSQCLADIEKVRTSLQTEFQATAAKLFEEKSAKFTEHNKTEINTLLGPLKQQLTDFRTRIDTVYKTESDDRSALKAQIEQLRQLNTTITDEARALTHALKGQAQARGAWGELVLERLLDAAGLVRGQDYLVQQSLATADGRRLRPDVILRLPDQRHLVVDSKLSLIAYEQSVNAATDNDRTTAVSAHLRAVRNHVDELSSKNYDDTGKLVTPDYVLMFVPLEPAVVLAVEADQSLYEWALERRVILCTAPTLLVTLKTIALLWKQNRQTKNVHEIARRGGLLYDKFAGLYADLEAVGLHLSRASTSYDDSLAKLKTGRGSILSQVEELKILGAKAQKNLPAPTDACPP